MKKTLLIGMLLLPCAAWAQASAPVACDANCGQIIADNLQAILRVLIGIAAIFALFFGILVGRLR